MNDPRRIRIKVCGMTRVEDALCAAEAGVDAIGFIFYRKSPRYIDPGEARKIIERLPPFIDPVGVFVNEQPEAVLETIRVCGLSYIQLHGAESPQYCSDLTAKMRTVRLLKAIRVGGQTTANEVAVYQHCIQGYLLDTFQAAGAVGGTGAAFDWTVIDRLRLPRPFLLAGGLGLENIKSELTQVRPFGVDANSGLETAPGIKNHTLIKHFVAAVRSVEGAC